MNRRLLTARKFLKLNFHQKNRLSEFFANTAVAAFAFTLLPQAIGIDKAGIGELILGSVIGTACLLASLWWIKDKHASR